MKQDSNDLKVNAENMKAISKDLSGIDVSEHIIKIDELIKGSALRGYLVMSFGKYSDWARLSRKEQIVVKRCYEDKGFKVVANEINWWQ